MIFKFLTVLPSKYWNILKQIKAIQIKLLYITSLISNQYYTDAACKVEYAAVNKVWTNHADIDFEELNNI
jgi:hypothetical protein